MATKPGEGEGAKKRGRPRRGTTSETNSRNNSPMVSPNRFQALSTDPDESWTCKVCKLKFTDSEDKILECQRCNMHFCIKCLDKSEEEYEHLHNSDSMWFCIPCKEKVVKNILVDRKIEDAFKEMTKKFDERITKIEDDLKEKCSKDETISIVREEVDKRMKEKEDTPTAATPEPQENSNVNEVLSEISERKQRENNIIIYGQEESESTDRENRTKHDQQIAIEVSQACDTEVAEEDLVKVMRLGKYTKGPEKSKRPLLVQFKEKEVKANLFKNIKKLKDNVKYDDTKIANDLTRSERENEKTLREKAKDMVEAETSGEFTYKVRGPPWARKIVKIKKIAEG